MAAPAAFPLLVKDGYPLVLQALDAAVGSLRFANERTNCKRELAPEEGAPRRTDPL
jgi:hypothetical protein